MEKILRNFYTEKMLNLKFIIFSMLFMNIVHVNKSRTFHASMEWNAPAHLEYTIYF